MIQFDTIQAAKYDGLIYFACVLFIGSIGKVNPLWKLLSLS